MKRYIRYEDLNETKELSESFTELENLVKKPGEKDD